MVNLPEVNLKLRLLLRTNLSSISGGLRPVAASDEASLFLLIRFLIWIQTNFSMARHGEILRSSPCQNCKRFNILCHFSTVKLKCIRHQLELSESVIKSTLVEVVIKIKECHNWAAFENNTSSSPRRLAARSDHKEDKKEAEESLLIRSRKTERVSLVLTDLASRPLIWF